MRNLIERCNILTFRFNNAEKVRILICELPFTVGKSLTGVNTSLRNDEVVKYGVSYVMMTVILAVYLIY